MIRRLTTRGMFGSCCALALALGVGALATPVSAQIPTNGVIYACIRMDRDGDEGRLARLVAANEACRRNEVRVQWNVVGPTGPTGPQGPQGPAGKNGVNGLNGLNGKDGQDGKDAPAGGISGQLQSCNGTSLANVLVHVPGRAFSVFTAADGKFQIDLMPQGTYDLSIERAGAIVATVTGVPVGTSVDPLLHPVLLDNTSNDPNSCGAPPTGCPAGQVECAPGVCVNTATDANNCGACGRACGAGATCVAGSCVAAAATCNDQVKNGTETDVDCGGGTCGTCAVGKVCNVNNDCSSGSCSSGTCQLGFCNITFYRDADGDGYGSSQFTVQGCAPPPGYVTNATDCDDSKANVNPGATEVCDGIDNNCNAIVDEGGVCAFLVAGQSCSADKFCVSGVCRNSVCQ